MSVQITTAFVQAYSSAVQLLSQQRASYLRSGVRVETGVVGKRAFFDQVGASAARKRTSRHADTPLMNTPHARRSVPMVDYDWADLIDKEDTVRTLGEFTNPYTQAAAGAMGRAMDDELIAAADGTAFTGEEGATQTAFDTNMIVNVQVGITPAADTGLNVGKLRRAKRLLDANEVDPIIPRFIACNAVQMDKLLGETQATSADFNTVKALVQGEINSFVGFTFLTSQRLGVDSSNDHKILFWAQNGLLLAIGAEPTPRIAERPDKNFATQAFYAMTIGATRMEEAKVGYIACDVT
jgi:hypothetical protein